jgi:hypothetical protein
MIWHLTGELFFGFDRVPAADIWQKRTITNSLIYKNVSGQNFVIEVNGASRFANILLHRTDVYIMFWPS